MNANPIAHAMNLACALIVCSSIASAQTTKSGSTKKTSPEVQGFSVVLVLGDLDGSSTGADNVPPAARKALADMKDFLPYKSYRLLDTLWILSGGVANGFNTNTSSRLRGPEIPTPGATGNGLVREYELVLSVGPEPGGSTSNGRLRVSFQLRDPSAPMAQLLSRRETVALPREASPTPSLDHMRAELSQRAETANLEARVSKERAELEQLRSQVEQRTRTQRTQSDQKPGALDQSRHVAEERQTEQVRQKMAELQAGLDGLLREVAASRNRGLAVLPRTVIDTGFSMSVGETVVVGTSRVQGDKAMIVLLTAVPRPS